MKGRAKTTSAESVGLVHIISATAPISRTTLRRAMEMLAPKALLIWVVSAVRREVISPVLAASKKAGSRIVSLAKTAARTSATTRSPRVITK